MILDSNLIGGFKPKRLALNFNLQKIILDLIFLF